MLSWLRAAVIFAYRARSKAGDLEKGDPYWEICGIPDTLYTDNGADFTSKHIEQVAVDLKIRLVFSTPGQPRGRGRIERFFRTVNEMFLCDLDGFGARPSRVPSLTLTDLDRESRKFLLEVYHRRRSSEGKPSPKERWEEGAFLPRMLETLEQLDFLLIHELRSRQVRPDGIHFHRFRCWSVRTSDGRALDTIFYTPDVITSPSQIRKDLRRAREIVSSTAQLPTRDETRTRLEGDTDAGRSVACGAQQ